MYSGKQSLSGSHFSRGPFSNGSATLQFIFSSGAGVLFVLLLADLSSYLRASSATHQALVATMRCITPTDADCLSGEALPGVNPAANLEADWFGFANTPETAVATLQEVTYSPIVEEFRWENTFNIFSVPDNSVTASFQTVEIPVRRYVARLNSWFDTWAPVNRIWEVRELLANGEVVVLSTLKDRQLGPMMYLPHGIEHGSHFIGADGTGNPAVDAFTSESWCLAGIHSSSLEDFNGNNIPDQIDTELLQVNPVRPLFVASYCQLEHDDFSWARQANCGWEGRDPIDPSYGTSDNQFYNSPSQPLATTASSNGLQQRGERPIAVTDSAQYLVVEVAGCSEGLEQQLNSRLNSLDSLVENFQTRPSGEDFTSPWRQSLASSGLLAAGSETFKPQGAIISNFAGSNSGLLASSPWTYLSLQSGSGSLRSDRELCSPWREITPGLESDPLFADIFDENYQSNLKSGQSFLESADPVVLAESDLSCAVPSEEEALFSCSDTAGCSENRLREKCHQELVEQNQTDPSASLQARNSSSVTGLSENFWHNFGDEIIPASSNNTSIPEDPSQISFTIENQGEPRLSTSALGCESLQPETQLTVQLPGEAGSACSRELLASNPPRLETWRSEISVQFPEYQTELDEGALNPRIVKAERKLAITDNRDLPPGLEGTWFGISEQNAQSVRCGSTGQCSDNTVSEVEALAQSIAEQYGEKYEGCKIVNPGRELGPFVLVENPSQFDPCISHSVSCVYPENLASSRAQFIATSRGQPESCSGANPEFRGCYSVAINNSPQLLDPDLFDTDPFHTNPLNSSELVNFSKAAAVGFSQLQRIEKNSHLSNADCGTTPGCTFIELEIDQDEVVRGRLVYNMSLGPVLGTVIGEDIIKITQQKRENFGLAKAGLR